MHLFPVEFRRDFGREMEREILVSLREAKDAVERLAVWRRALWDLAISVPREHWDTWIGPDGGNWEMGGIIQDAGRALRSLRKSPGFTAVVVLTLGLGIGATTAIYSVAYGVLLAPLPYPDADRIVTIQERFEGTQQGFSVSYVNAQDWKKTQTTFEGIALALGGALALTGGDGAEQLSAVFVDAEYFDILGAKPAIGRLFGVEDNRVPGGHPIVVLAYDAWQTRFGGDPDIVGSSINLNGTPFTVTGVLSADHRYPFPGANGAGNDLFAPAMMAGQIDPRGDDVVRVRRWRIFGAIGKLRPGVTPEDAQADLERIAARLIEDFPDTNRGIGVLVFPFGELASRGIRGPVLTLLGGAVVLLFIACFNVANLLLVRGASREQEMAVQLALGAGRGRLFRLLSVESLIIALTGGGLGVFAAAAALPSMLSLAPNQLPPTADVAVSLPVLGGALLATLIAGVSFGLFPALKVSGVDLRGPLSGTGRSLGDRKGAHVRNGLILFEIATATILLASSALLIRSFQELRRSDSGFNTENILTMRLNLPAASYTDGASMAAAAEQLTERIEALPGVEWSQPWGPNRPGLTFSFQSSVPDGMVVDRLSDSPLSRRHQVGPGTLEDMGIPLLRGRGIEAADRAGTAPVVVVSESMANELWPGEDPLGKQYHAFQPPGAPIPSQLNWTVVGVVADANHGGRVPPPQTITTSNDAYYPIAQRPERAFTMLVKTTNAPELGPIREAVRAFDPNIPIFQVATVAENFEQEEGTARFAAQLMGGFGLAALLLAALGVYGVIAFTVTQKTREIGLRAALGAEPGNTRNHFLVYGMKLAGGGVVLGTVTAFGAARGLQSILPNVPEMDAVALAIAAGSLVVVAALACLIPAYRATRIAPVVALEGE